LATIARKGDFVVTRERKIFLSETVSVASLEREIV